MIDTIMLRISEWRDYLKRHDMWDKGDCTIVAQIYDALKKAYGGIDEPTNTDRRIENGNDIS